MINGRNHLALKNALMQQMGLTPGQPVVPGQVPAVVRGYVNTVQLLLSIFIHSCVLVDVHQCRLYVLVILMISLSNYFVCFPQATNPYLAGVAGQTYNPYFAAAGPLVPLVSDPTGATVMSPLGVPQQTVVQQKVPRGNEVHKLRNLLQ